jgi:hypothetical protein
LLQRDVVATEQAASEVEEEGEIRHDLQARLESCRCLYLKI